MATSLFGKSLTSMHFRLNAPAVRFVMATDLNFVMLQQRLCSSAAMNLSKFDQSIFDQHAQLVQVRTMSFVSGRVSTQETPLIGSLNAKCQQQT